MDEPAPEQPGDPSPSGATDPTPPLSILHLLVGTACMAMYLSAFLGLMRLLNALQPGPNAAPLQSARGVLLGVVLGLSFAGLVLLIARRRRGLRFPVHPGEFLYVSCGLDAVATLVIIGVIMVIQSYGASAVSMLFWLIAGGYNIPALVVSVWALWQARERRWLLVWLSIPLDVGIELLLVLFGDATALSRVPLSSLVCTATLLADRREWGRRPWSHWLGVGLYLYFGLWQAAAWLPFVVRWF